MLATVISVLVVSCLIFRALYILCIFSLVIYGNSTSTHWATEQKLFRQIIEIPYAIMEICRRHGGNCRQSPKPSWEGVRNGLLGGGDMHAESDRMSQNE